jgi:hypothetical protein
VYYYTIDSFGIEVNFHSLLLLMSICDLLLPAGLIFIQKIWQSPSNAHAYRLYIFKELRYNQQLTSC